MSTNCIRNSSVGEQPRDNPTTSPTPLVTDVQNGESISEGRELGERGIFGEQIYTYKNLLLRAPILHPLDLQQKSANVSDLILVPRFHCMLQGSFVKFLCHVHVTLDLSRYSMCAQAK